MRPSGQCVGSVRWVSRPMHGRRVNCGQKSAVKGLVIAESGLMATNPCACNFLPHPQAPPLSVWDACICCRASKSVMCPLLKHVMHTVWRKLTQIQSPSQTDYRPS